MAELISIYWRDIPAQVIGRDGRDTLKSQLDPRFERAIDRAAMHSGRDTPDAYLAGWRRESEQVEGDIEALVAQKVEALEQAFSEDYLERVVENGGLAEGEGPE